MYVFDLHSGSNAIELYIGKRFAAPVHRGTSSTGM